MNEDRIKSLQELVAAIVDSGNIQILYMWIVECISSDTNFTMEDAERHIVTLTELKAALDSMTNLPEKVESIKPKLDDFISRGAAALLPQN